MDFFTVSLWLLLSEIHQIAYTGILSWKYVCRSIMRYFWEVFEIVFFIISQRKARYKNAELTEWTLEVGNFVLLTKCSDGLSSEWGIIYAVSVLRGNSFYWWVGCKHRNFYKGMYLTAWGATQCPCEPPYTLSVSSISIFSAVYFHEWWAYLNFG